LAGLLLGTAGLLGQASLAEAHAFRAFERSRGARQMLSSRAWDGRQQRAANTPAQRCRGLAELAARWTDRTPRGATTPAAGPIAPTGSPRSPLAPDGLVGLLGRPSAPGARPASGGPAEQIVTAVAEAATSKRARPLWRLVYAPPWIGRGRAQVLVVNVLLPLAAALGVAEAAELFERLPGEPSNRVYRCMAEQLAAPGLRLGSACRQQGLLHLFKTGCGSEACCAGRPARGSPLSRAYPCLGQRR
jgi:hypothetical protein